VHLSVLPQLLRHGKKKVQKLQTKTTCPAFGTSVARPQLLLWKNKGFENLKAAFSEHLTHTRFISRKVGFSRRCLPVSLTLSNPTPPYAACGRAVTGGYPGGMARPILGAQPVPCGEPDPGNEGGPGQGPRCAEHGLDRGGAAFPPPGADTIMIQIIPVIYRSGWSWNSCQTYRLPPTVSFRLLPPENGMLFRLGRCR
jgi:hypothetical protein